VNGSDKSGDLSVDWSIELSLILKKKEVRVCT